MCARVCVCVCHHDSLLVCSIDHQGCYRRVWRWQRCTEQEGDRVQATEGERAAQGLAQVLG